VETEVLLYTPLEGFMVGGTVVRLIDDFSEAGLVWQ